MSSLFTFYTIVCLALWNLNTWPCWFNFSRFLCCPGKWRDNSCVKFVSIKLLRYQLDHDKINKENKITSLLFHHYTSKTEPTHVILLWCDRRQALKYHNHHPVTTIFSSKIRGSLYNRKMPQNIEGQYFLYIYHFFFFERVIFIINAEKNHQIIRNHSGSRVSREDLTSEQV